MELADTRVGVGTGPSEVARGPGADRPGSWWGPSRVRGAFEARGGGGWGLGARQP